MANLVSHDTMERHLIQAVQAEADELREAVIQKAVADFDKALREAVMRQAVNLTSFYNVVRHGDEVVLTVRCGESRRG